MRKVFVLTLSILIISVLGHSSLPIVYAGITVKQDPKPVCQDSGAYTLTFTGGENAFVQNKDYTLGIWKPGTNPNSLEKALNITWDKAKDTQTIVKVVSIVGDRATLGQWHYKLWLGAGTDVLKKEPKSLISSGEYVMFPKEACTLGLPILEMSSPVEIGVAHSIQVININPDSEYLVWFLGGRVFNNGKFPPELIREENKIKIARLWPVLDKPGTKTLCLKHGKTNFLGFGKDNCEISIPIEVTATTPQVTPIIIQSGKPGASLEESTLFLEPTTIPPLPPCSQWANLQGTPIPVQQTENGKDIKCIGVNTAIGEISTEPQGFVKRIFSFVLGIAGGIALILIIISGYRLMASQGNPEQITAARDQLISAIVGLLFIIFSFVILEVIGVDILKIPGFTK